VRRTKVRFTLNNDEQRKSIAKNFHDVSKALFIAWLIDCILKDNMLSTTGLKLISVAILCVAAGLRTEESIGRNGNDQP